jgi:hypothetical protein
VTAPNDRLADLNPRAPRRLLDELAGKAARAAAQGKERPQVSVMLATGRELAGRVVAIGDEGGVVVLALHVDQVIAVTVDVAPDKPAFDGPPPGRLELARALGDHAAALAAALGGAPVALSTADPLGDDERHAVAAALPTLAKVLLALAADDLGKDALRGLAAIKVGAAGKGSVSQSAGTLSVDVPRSSDDAWDERAMRREIEKAL